MGLIVGLLTLPIAPVRGVVWVAEKVAEQAEAELYDEASITRELAQLDEALTGGEISQEIYDAYADELLDRLETGRQLALERGGGVG
jgi:hypothetical protein